MTAVGLSAIIPCRDRARHLDTLIARLLAPPPRDDCEIIVVDASVYDEAARFVCGTFREQHPSLPLLYLRVAPGTSFAHCSNAGIFHARGEHIAVLDLDAEGTDVLPWLALDRSPHAGDAPAETAIPDAVEVSAHGALGTVVLEAGADMDALARKLERALFGRGAGMRRVLIVCLDTQRAEIEAALSWRTRPLPILSFPAWDDTALPRLAAAVATDRVAFLPAAAPFSTPAWDELPEDALAILPWVPLAHLPIAGNRQHAAPAGGWIAPRDLLEAVSATEFPGLTQLAVPGMRFRSAPASAPAPRPPPSRSEDRPMTSQSSVLVIIPHYQCEAWLAQCLDSVLRQTRPAQAIAVIDDASTQPPVELVRRFPGVTLLRAHENVGPYRLIQSLIAQTDYDAYLFQDADDWSAEDRLELLLAEAQRTGAGLIGSQAITVGENGRAVIPTCYPLDVNRALAQAAAHSLLHPSSLVARAVVLRIGGFANGMRYGADTELQLRAAYVTRIVNVDRYCYFYRARTNSLTGASTTGLASDARQVLYRELIERAQENATRVAQGRQPDLAPMATAPNVVLEHLAGPPLSRSEERIQRRPLTEAAPIEVAATTERYCARPLVQLPAGDDQVLLVPPGGEIGLVSRDAAATLTGWRSLTRLDQQVGMRRRAGASDVFGPGLRPDYFLSDAALVASAKAAGPDPLGPPPKIETVGLVTRDRIQCLLRGIVSFSENAGAHHRTVGFIVADDTGDPAAREQTRARLRQLAATRRVPIRYAGMEEKAAFAAALVASGAASERIVKLALCDPAAIGCSVGANRNALLLDTVGELSFSADDDMICTVHSVPQPQATLLLSSARSPLRFWFDPHFREILRSADADQIDVLGAHETLLGRSVASCIAGVGAENLHCDRMSDRLAHAAATAGGRVVVTLNGFFGDGGLPAPAVYLLLEDDSRDRLLHTRADYERACSSRELLRLVMEPTVSDAAWGCQTGTIGYDNRLLLPPFFPVLRGEDFLFGLIISSCFADGFLGYVPHAVLHAPPEPRRFAHSDIWTSPSHLRLAHIVAACVSSAHYGVARRSPADRLAALGAWLSELGSLPPEEFEVWLRERMYRTQSAYIESVEQLRERYGRRPTYWDKDLERQLTELRRALTRRDFMIPQDLAQGRDIDATRRLTQTLVRDYGELLSRWPTIVEAARTLRTRGMRVSRELG